MAIRSSDQVAAVRPPALTAIKVRAAKAMLTSGAVSIGARLRESGKPALGSPCLSINGERRQRGSGTLVQKLHLELAKRAEYVDDQPPGRAGSIDVLVQRPMPRAFNVSTVVRSRRMDRVKRSSRWTTSTSPVAGKLQGGGKLSAIRSGAAHRFLEHALEPRSIERVDLTIGGLEICRNAGITHQHRKSPRSRPTPDQSGEWY
jgi:hypothetical protein